MWIWTYCFLSCVCVCVHLMKAGRQLPISGKTGEKYLFSRKKYLLFLTRITVKYFPYNIDWEECFFVSRPCNSTNRYMNLSGLSSTYRQVHHQKRLFQTIKTSLSLLKMCLDKFFTKHIFIMLNRFCICNVYMFNENCY